MNLSHITLRRTLRGQCAGRTLEECAAHAAGHLLGADMLECLGLVVGVEPGVGGPAVEPNALAEHIETYVDTGPSALVFTTEGGVPIRRGSFNKLFGWTEVVAGLGFKGLHFHDLRHTGNTLAANSNVSTRDLMARMGQDSMEAALIYQHRSAEADRSIADHMDAQARKARKPKKKTKKPPRDDDDVGTAGVLARTG